jgi:hypothetical protein
MKILIKCVSIFVFQLKPGSDKRLTKIHFYVRPTQNHTNSNSYGLLDNENMDMLPTGTCRMNTSELCYGNIPELFEVVIMYIKVTKNSSIFLMACIL